LLAELTRSALQGFSLLAACASWRWERALAEFSFGALAFARLGGTTALSGDFEPRNVSVTLHAIFFNFQNCHRQSNASGSAAIAALEGEVYSLSRNTIIAVLADTRFELPSCHR